MAGNPGIRRVGIEFSAKGNLSTHLQGYERHLAKLHRLTSSVIGNFKALDSLGGKGLGKQADILAKLASSTRTLGGLRTNEAKQQRESLRLDNLRATLAEKLRATQAKALATEESALGKLLAQDEKISQAKLKTRTAEAKAIEAEQIGLRRVLAQDEKISQIHARTRQIDQGTQLLVLRGLEADDRRLILAQRFEQARMRTHRMEQQIHRDLLEQAHDYRQIQRFQEKASHVLPYAGNLIQPGMSVFRGLRETLEPAQKLDTARASFRQLNLTEGENQKAFGFARVLSKNLRGVSQHDALETLQDMHVITGSLGEAIAGLPSVAKFAFASKQLGGMTHKQIQDSLKAAEMISKGKTPEEIARSFRTNLDTMMHIQSGTSFRVKGGDFLSMFKTAGMARFKLNSESLYNLAGLVQEQGGFRTGTGMMSAFSNLLLGRTSEKAANALIRERLIQSGHVVYSKGKGHKPIGFEGFSIVDAGTLQSNPMEWFHKHMDPILKKYGENKGLVKIGEMMSNRTGLNLAVTDILQYAKFKKDAKIAKNAKGIEESYANTLNSYAGGLAQFNAALEDFKARVGTTLLPNLAKMLHGLTDALVKLNDLMDKHPTITNFAVGGTAVAAAGMVGVGAVGAARAAWALPGFLSAGAAGGIAAAEGEVAGSVLGGAAGTYISAMLAKSPIARILGAGIGKIMSISIVQKVGAALPGAFKLLGTAALWAGVAVLGYAIGRKLGDAIQSALEKSGWADGIQNAMAHFMPTGGLGWSPAQQYLVDSWQARNRQANPKTSSLTQPVTIQNNIYLDGKKIGESVIKTMGGQARRQLQAPGRISGNVPAALTAN